MMHYGNRNKGQDMYDEFDATELYCPQCKRAVPVRKRLLLVLSNGDKYDYVCSFCGTSVGEKMNHNKDNFNIFMKQD